MRKVLRVAVPLGVVAALFVPQATGRTSWLDRLRGSRGAPDPGAGEALAAQVTEAVRARFGRPLRPSDTIHFVTPPRPVALRAAGPPPAELDAYAERIPDEGSAWRPLGLAHDGYGALLLQVDPARVYGAAAGLREALRQFDAARRVLDPTARPAPAAAERLRESLVRLEQAAAAEKEPDQRRRQAGRHYARAFTRYLDFEREGGKGTAPPAHPSHRLDPLPRTWQRSEPPRLLAAAFPPPASPASKAGAAAAERVAEIAFKRIGVLKIEPADWFDGEALRSIAESGLLPDAKGAFSRALPRMPVLLLVASDPSLAIELPGVRPEDVAGGSVGVLGTPRETSADFHLETDAKGARLIYEPATLYVLGVVSSEVHRP